jgi:hypothetical protein
MEAAYARNYSHRTWPILLLRPLKVNQRLIHIQISIPLFTEVAFVCCSEAAVEWTYRDESSYQLIWSLGGFRERKLFQYETKGSR